MSEPLRTCPQGHRWQPATDSSPAQPGTNETCPVCGAAAETLVPQAGQTPGASDDASSAIADTLRPGPDATPAAPISTATPTAATITVPGYEIQSELGRGGMGVVYRAMQKSLQRNVALKMLVAGPLASSALRARFRIEAEAVAQLSHPNIVQIYEIGEAAGHAFIALEYVGGGTLAERSRARRPTPREAARTVATLARAVHFAHQNGIVHRDLKPANVLLTADGTPKIADFGLAKLLATPSGETHTGDVMGSPSYMSPEQARGATHQVGAPSDVYALGAILYELLTGYPPFVGQDTMETILLVLSEEPVSPRRLSPGVPRDLETICLKCLEKVPRLRYESADALAEDLERFVAGRPVAARPAGPIERLAKWARRRPAVAALVAVVVASTATIITYGAWKNGQLRASLSAEQAQRQRTETNFRKALDAADRRLTRAGQDPRRLLAEELVFYNEIRRQPGDDPQIRYERGMAARRAGDVLRLLGDAPLGEKAYLEAIDLLSTLSKADPTNVEYRRDLAAAHNGLAQLLQASDRPDETERHFREGARLLAQLADEVPDEVDFRRQLGVLWNNLAIHLAKQGRLEAAETAHQTAIALRQRLASDSPQTPGFQLDASISLANLAALYLKQQRPADALGKLRESIAIRAALPESITAEADFRLSTAAIFNNLASALAKTGATSEAPQAFRQSIVALAQLAENYPAVPAYRTMLADAHTNLGLQLAVNGQVADAAPSFAAALVIWKQLAAEDPQTAAYSEKAQRVQLLLHDAEGSAAPSGEKP